MLALLNRIQLQIRSGLFYGYYVLITALFSFIALFILYAPFKLRYSILCRWSLSCIYGLRLICGVRYSVSGLENLPKDQPYVVLSKHQSQWETFYLMYLLRPVSIICKKELLKIPGFGLCLKLVNPIAIDRSNPKKALKDIQRLGLERLQKDKVPVLIFPEGTRTDIGKTGKYARGGAALAIKAEVPVVFISHNAGYCWPSNRFLKSPGHIDVVISPVIQSAGKTALELTQEAESWIESQVVYHNAADNPHNNKV